MKKNIILKIILCFIIIITIFISIDIKQLKKGNEPIFCVNIKTYRDGGTKEYIGIGYKVIKYNNNKRKDFQIGTFFLKYK